MQGMMATLSLVPAGVLFGISANLLHKATMTRSQQEIWVTPVVGLQRDSGNQRWTKSRVSLIWVCQTLVCLHLWSSKSISCAPTFSDIYFHFLILWRTGYQLHFPERCTRNLLLVNWCMSVPHCNLPCTVLSYSILAKASQKLSQSQTMAPPHSPVRMLICCVLPGVTNDNLPHTPDVALLQSGSGAGRTPF